MKASDFLSLLLTYICCITCSCLYKHQPTGLTTISSPPNYESYTIIPTTDTISFALDSIAFNEIKNFNYFNDGENELIQFYDARSQTISIYEFNTKKLLKIHELKNIFRNSLYNTTVYVKKPDTILVTNKNTLYIINNNGIITDSIPFLTKPFLSRIKFESLTPPIFTDKTLIAKSRPSLKSTSISDLRKWKTLYNIDLEKKKLFLTNNLPESYQAKEYNVYFYDFSYCVSENGTLIFSFPADTFIYESNLKEYSTAYYAKSKNHDIQNATTEVHSKYIDKTFKEYLSTFSYGSMYFDAANKRYLRVAKKNVSQQEIDQKNFQKQQTFIILNNGFQIIGESEYIPNISYSSLFFSKSGKMYARVASTNDDEVKFIRLEYKYKNEKNETRN